MRNSKTGKYYLDDCMNIISDQWIELFVSTGVEPKTIKMHPRTANLISCAIAIHCGYSNIDDFFKGFWLGKLELVTDINVNKGVFSIS